MNHSVLKVLKLTFWNKLLTDCRCSNSKSVNRVSYYGFKCLSGSLSSTDKSECVAKFRFASALRSNSRSMYINLYICSFICNVVVQIMYLSMFKALSFHLHYTECSNFADNFWKALDNSGKFLQWRISSHEHAVSKALDVKLDCSIRFAIFF